MNLRLIWVLTVVAGATVLFYVTYHKPATFIDTPIPATSTEIQSPPPMRMWKCHQLVTCPDSDWRATRPEDVCTYVDDIETALYDPAMSFASYGAHCEEFDPKG